MENVFKNAKTFKRTQSVQSDYFTNRQNEGLNLCSFAISGKISKKFGKSFPIGLSVALGTSGIMDNERKIKKNGNDK
ncbi:MAG: hypothetical protein Q4D17_04945 [Planctomycetia bacterium]|nr:hypothetical protein [Planctomycetia bacterium]